MTIRVGVAGLGYWGPNLARNFAGLPGCELTWCCDASEAARERVRARRSRTRASPPTSTTCSRDPELDAIVLATPVPTHGALAEQVLRAGKHCFVEKPLAQSVADAERAVAAAAETGRILMVGHLLQYHPGVAKLKEIADSGELGEIHYIYSNRLNLGQLRADENALWSLGAHDVSVLLHLADEEPSELDARGESYMRQGIEDVVFGYLRFPSGLAAHLHLSWLDPHKERRFTVVGSQPDGDLRRHGHRAQGHRLRQGLRREHRRPTASTSPAPGTSGARGSRTASRCGSSASTSSSASARAARRSPTARAGCGWCGCWRGCRRGSTRRGGSSVRPSDLAPGLFLGDGVQLGEGVAARGARRHPPRHGGGRRLRDPGPRGARQAAEARPPLERAARGAGAARAGPGRRGLLRGDRVRRRGARRGRDRRRPGLRARARADRRGQRDRARDQRRQRRDDRRAGAGPDRRLPDRRDA